MGSIAPHAASVLTDAIMRPDIDSGVRWNASKSIGTLGEDAGNATALYLAKALMQRKPGQLASDPYLRSGLAHTLGNMASASQGSGSLALARALMDDRDPNVRRQAAASLGNLGAFIAGKHGAFALGKALVVDPQPRVRSVCAEALGAFKEGAGKDGADGLIKSLHDDPDVNVRWRCAVALGMLGYSAGEQGAEALLKHAAPEEKSLAVKEQSEHALFSLRDGCVKFLDGHHHPYLRGQAAWVIGKLGRAAEQKGVEALVATLFRPSEEKYMRRRAAEGLGKLGADAGCLGALALKRAAQEDRDVYIQWQAGELFGELPLQTQALADAPEAVQELEVLKENDAVKQAEIKKAREGQPLVRWEIELEPIVTEPVAEVAEEPAPVEEQVSPPPPPPPPEVSISEAVNEEAFPEESSSLKDAPAAEPELTHEAQEEKIVTVPEPDDPEKKLVEDSPVIDTARSREIFARFAIEGVVSREDLSEALELLGHEGVNSEWVDAIISGQMNDRSFLDNYDFGKFLAEYEAVHWDFVRQKFAEADTDGSGLVSAEELAEVIRRLGMTPVTGVVEQLIAEVCGPRVTQVNFHKFARLLGIFRHRFGFTRDEYTAIMTAFRRHDRDRDGKLGSLDLRSCLYWLGFDITLQEAAQCIHGVRTSGGHKRKEDATGEQEEHLVVDYEVAKIVRAIREKEAQEVISYMLRMKGEADTLGVDGAARAIDAADLPTVLMDLHVTLASPQVVHEALESYGIAAKEQLTVEDIMPVLWFIRRCQGFNRAEMDQAQRLFQKADEDGSEGMAGAELEKAIRSLGFPVTLDEIQEQLDEWDLDETGELDFMEFLKLLANYKQKELGSVLAAMQKGTNQKPAAVHLAQGELPSVLLKVGHCPLREESQVLSSCLDPEVAQGRLDFWGFVGKVDEYRNEINSQIRKNQGYTEVEVAQLKEKFDSYDPEHTGVIAKKRLRQLLLDLVPAAERSQEGRNQMAEIVKESDADASGSIDFEEFIVLSRLVSNRWSKEKLNKEQRAVRDTKFSLRELKEFRKVYRAYDMNESGDLSFPELQQMIAGIVDLAKGVAGESQLQEIFRMFDENNDDMLDFSEFIRVIRKLLDDNWGGIKERTEQVTFDEQTAEA
eukprot:TRINITY_DN36691_c0_g1_i1.p1 TRINITY_DN36691_c0_g1~~TRINITY_DN36691_c0_g1_i1.p1  ORF type:complete len:1182 (-),score=270.57 TRINITY_DN36691_c0_g1_i1:36-3404(-)